jgi:hypothetical protein
MQLDVYLIRGRGDDGHKFQLAMVRNTEDHYYQGEYDPALQYSTLDELKSMLSTMVNVPVSELVLNELNM